MPNDYVTINALTQELNSMLKEGKIDKINMPEKDEVSLAIRANNTNYVLAISCNASYPRMHLTTQKKANPIVAPSFCMHLRKYLTNGIIKSITTLNEDRIVSINILSHNEMRDEVLYKIIVEMMGRYSNIVLLNEKNIITDALKQISFDMMTKRTLLPSVLYSVPEQSKIPLSHKNEIQEILKNYTGGSISTMLSNSISGVAKNTAKAIVDFAMIDDCSQSLSSNEIQKIISSISTFENIFHTKTFNPCTSIINGISQEYFVTKYPDIQEFRTFSSLDAAIDDCLAKKDELFRRQEKTKFLSKAYNSFLSRCEKKLEKSTQKYSESQEKDIYKLYGELIISNIYKIKKGDKSCNVINYYDENQSEINIKLDETLAPQQNAQQYFKKYTKLKHAEEISIKQIKELNDTIEYLKTIEPFIIRCSTTQEIAEVQKELENIGALKPSNYHNKRKEKESLPLSYDVDGFTILVGKNNLQNDKLTFKIANGGDLWMHTKSFHGSHTIILTEGREVPKKVLLTAGEICAAFSDCENENKVEVDYSFRKNVKRHPNKNPGMVIYVEYNTIVVTPNVHKEYIK